MCLSSLFNVLAHSVQELLFSFFWHFFLTEIISFSLDLHDFKFFFELLKLLLFQDFLVPNLVFFSMSGEELLYLFRSNFLNVFSSRLLLGFKGFFEGVIYVLPCRRSGSRPGTVELFHCLLLSFTSSRLSFLLVLDVFKHKISFLS